MDTPRTTGIELLAPSDASTALALTPLQPTAARTFRLTHAYLEIVYLPLVGPTSVLLARYLGRLLASSGGTTTVCAAALARELGLRARSGDPLGTQSRLVKSIARLEHHRLVRWLDDRRLGIMTEAPAVTDTVRAKLPPAAQYAHDQFIDVINMSETRH